MFISTAQFKESCRRHLVVTLLLSLAVMVTLSFVALVSFPSQPKSISYVTREQGVVARQPVLKISEIQGSRIDDEAATIVIRESAPAPDGVAADCFTIPANIWAFLVAAYVALLIFNFSYTFGQTTKTQWFWETLYTFSAMVGWYSLDDCRTAPWFPFAIVEFGLITFALYAYLLEKKLLEKEKAEKTESMF